MTARPLSKAEAADFLSSSPAIVTPPTVCRAAPAHASHPRQPAAHGSRRGCGAAAAAAA